MAMVNIPSATAPPDMNFALASTAFEKVMSVSIQYYRNTHLYAYTRDTIRNHTIVSYEKLKLLRYICFHLRYCLFTLRTMLGQRARAGVVLNPQG